MHRLPGRCLTALIVAGLPFASPVLKAQSDPCTLFPPTPATCSTRNYPQPDRAGLISITEVNYAEITGPAGWSYFGLSLYDSPESARREFDRIFANETSGPAAPARAVATGDFGEASFTSPTVQFTRFVRGCYNFTMGGIRQDPEKIEFARKIAAQIDENIKNAPCPSGAPSSNAAVLQVGLACDTDALEESGEVICVASVINRSTDSNITYEWSYDDEVQSALTAGSITISGVDSGSHTVSVRVRDIANNLTAEPQAVTFTRGQPGASAPETPPPLILGAHAPEEVPQVTRTGTRQGIRFAGPAIAVMIAVSVLLGLTRRMRRREPAAASPPPSPTKPPEKVAPAFTDPLSQVAQPLGAPVMESRREMDEPPRRETDEPIVSFRVVAGNSVLTKDNPFYALRGPCMLGDGVDSILAGYEATVTPETKWVIQSVKPSFAIEGSAKSESMPDKSPPDQQLRLTTGWEDADVSFTVRASADIVVRHRTTGVVRPFREVDSTGVQISVIGAHPKLVLRAYDPIKREMVSAGYADGSCEVRVEPDLWMFDEPYPGGLGIVPQGAEVQQDFGIHKEYTDPNTGEKISFSTYFDGWRDEYWLVKDPRYRDERLRVESQQGITLRCKFHLDDKDLKKLPAMGYPVSFAVEPTGDGPAAMPESIEKQHFSQCAGRYKGGIPLSKNGEASIQLVPSRIQLKVDAPALPRDAKTSAAIFGDDDKEEKEPVFGTSVTGVVIGRDEKPISGHLILPDITGEDKLDYRKWYLQLDWQPPGPPGYTAWSLPIAGVDHTGNLLFDDAGRLSTKWLYNHETFLWDGKVFWNDDIYEFTWPRRGSSAVLQISFLLDSKPLDVLVAGKSGLRKSLDISVGNQPESVRVCFDHPLFWVTRGVEGNCWTRGEMMVKLRAHGKYGPERPMTPRTLKSEWDARGGLPLGSIITIGNDHAGMVIAGPLIRHFLQALPGGAARNTGPFHQRQGKFLNRDQLRRLKVPHAKRDFEHAHVYIDTFDEYFRRNTMNLKHDTAPTSDPDFNKKLDHWLDHTDCFVYEAL